MTAVNESRAPRRRFSRKGAGIAALLVLAAIVAALGAKGALLPRLFGERGPLQTAKAATTGLEITVPAEGELTSVRTWACYLPRIPIRWDFKIASMVPEGTRVTKGQPILRLDAQDLEKQLTEKQFEYDTAVKELEKEEADRVTRARECDLEIDTARADREKKKMKAGVDSSLQSVLTLQEAAIDLQIAERKLELLVRKREALEEESRAKVRFTQGKRDAASREVKTLNGYIESLTVKTAADGVVIYRTDWRGEKRKVGDAVWGGWPMLEVADLGEMQVSGELKEEDARFVKPGQPAEVRLDAYPDRKYPAEVLSVSRFARRKDVRKAGKIFDIRLRLRETDNGVMRPGMHAKLAITIENIRGAVTVPVEAVFDDGGRSVVYVRKGLRTETREVHTGRRNDTHIVILDGLDPGEEVYCERPDAS